MMVRGRPFTNENGWEDSELIDSLESGEIETCVDWIKNNITKRKTPNNNHTSYGMKHLLERDTGIYLTNNQFKDAMILCGFVPIDENELNWTYCISEKSRAFKKKVW